MSTFKKILESKSEISQKDMKRLQRAAAAKTPEQAKKILKNLESAQERASRTTRTVPSAKSPSTVEQTPLNKYIRGEAEKGRGVSQELRDTAGIDDAERRGYIKPEKAGETKPAQGATRRARARGAAARQGVDVSAEPPKTPRRNVRLGNVTRGGPVRVTTLKPTKPAPAPKPEAIKQARSSKQQAAYRKARQQLKASGTKFFGKPTGVDAQGKPTYVPPKETPKGETGRRAQRQASPRSYASVKAEIEGAKGFSGSKSGGLETRTVPKPVTDYRQKRAGRAGLPDPFDPKISFSQKSFDKDLQRAKGLRGVTTANPLSQAEFKSKLVRGKNRPPLFPKPDFPATVPNTKPKPPKAPDRTLTKQAVKELRASRQRLNVKPAPTTGDLVTKSKPVTPPVETNTLAVRQSGISKQGRGPVAGPYDVIDVDVKVDPPKKPPLLNPSQQKKVTQRILKTAKPQLGKRLATRTVPDLAKKVTTQAATKTATKLTPGRVLGGALGAGFDVVQGREDAKKAGASDRRAWLRGAARAVGGLAGGSLGALAGGGFGSFALGTAGYMAGSQVGDKLFTSLAGGTQKQKDWLKQRNLATQAGTKAKDVQYRKGNQAVVFDKRVGKERIGTWDPKSQTYKAGMTNPTKAYTAKNPFERLGRQFARSNEGSGLFGMGLVKGYGLADMAKRYYANKDEAARRKRVSDFKSTATR